MENIKFSIIIPCYNVEKNLIARAVKSILSQTYTNFELLLIDDGSKQEYLSALKEIADSDSRIKLIIQENQGVSVARNNGIKCASGQYILFLDADDIYLQGILERANDLLKADETIECYFGGLKHTSNVKIRDLDNVNVERLDLQESALEQYRIKALTRETIPGGFIGKGPICKFVKAELAKKILFDARMKYGEDHIWFLKILEETKHAVLDKQIWYDYWINPNSVTNKFNPNIYDNTSLYLDELFKFIDLTDRQQIKAYGDKISTMINTIWRCYLGNISNKDAKGTIKKMQRSIYRDKRYKLLGSYKYIRVASKKQKVVGMLYKFRLLFIFLKLTKYTGEVVD